MVVKFQGIGRKARMVTWLCSGFTCYVALHYNSVAYAVLWETQADRLQNISSTLLDGLPAQTPMGPADFGLGLFADLSFLPKPNTTVGAKTEKAPSSPVHMVPSLFAAKLHHGNGYNFGLRSYGGYLPVLPKSVTKLEAKASQFSFGATTQLAFKISSSFLLYSQLGLHYTKAKVEGKISSKHGTDTFETSNTLPVVTLGLCEPKSGMFFGYSAGLRNATSRLFIEEDQTSLQLDDKLQDAKVKVFSQPTLGWKSAGGLVVAASFLYVPSRLYMPKLSFEYAIWQSPEKSAAIGELSPMPAHDTPRSHSPKRPNAKAVEKKERKLAPAGAVPTKARPEKVAPARAKSPEPVSTRARSEKVAPKQAGEENLTNTALESEQADKN